MGYPGYVRSDEEPDELDADILFSDLLPQHWHEIDAFEGADYERIIVEFTTTDGSNGQGYVYALKH